VATGCVELLSFLFVPVVTNPLFLSAEVVSYSTAMVPSDLPVGKARRKSEGKATGKAAQAFNVKNDQQGNYCGYIMGNLALPPGGIKDAESVGPCSQTFTVCLGQPQALEVAYNDPDEPDGGDLNPKTAQRFLLGPGDLFRVPAGNCYRLENHSKESDCLLTWTIIKPRYLPSGGEP
jgi:centromere protein C